MKQLTLAVFIDAFGWEILRANRFLEDLAPFRRKLKSIFGYSCSAVPTILSGSNPSEHGHLSFFYRSKSSPFRSLGLLSFLPGFIANRGRVRNLLSRAVARYYGFTGYFQLYNVPFEHIALFDYCEKRDMYEPGGMSPSETIFDVLLERGIPYFVSDWRKGEGHNLDQAARVIEKGDARFVYVYTAAMDSLLHRVGKDHESIPRKVAFYDARIRELVSLARRNYDRTTLLVFSDHGMHTVRKTIDLISIVERAGLTFGRDYSAVYDSTMARFWFNNSEAEYKIRRLLEKIEEGRIVDDASLRSWGSYFPDGRYGELFFLLDGGIVIAPSFMGEKAPVGMHGYDPDTADAFAMMVSSDPIPASVRALKDIKRHLLQSTEITCDERRAA